MDDDRAAFREAWKYRAALRRFQSAFEAAEGLAEAERQLLLEQVANWLLRHMAHVPAEEPKTAEVVGVEINWEPPNGEDGDPPEAA
jgi:hypothetical protein